MVLDKTLPPILVGRLLDLPDLPYWWVNSWTYLTSLIGGSTPGLTWTPIRCQTPCHHTLHDSWTFVARLPVIVHSMTPGLTWTPIRCQTPCHHALHDTWTHLDSHSLPDSLSSCTQWLLNWPGLPFVVRLPVIMHSMTPHSQVSKKRNICLGGIFCVWKRTE